MYVWQKRCVSGEPGGSAILSAVKRRPLGASGLQASVVAFGAWAVGGWRWGGADEKVSIGALHAALDAGVNFIDTAPAYGFGIGEEIVGKAVEGRRDRVLIATKCGLSWDTDRGVFFFAADDKGRHEQGFRRIHKYLGAEAVRNGLEGSLRRLRTDYVDLYLTHWQDPTTPVEDTMDVLLDLKRQGKIRAIGACNASPADLERYRARGSLDADQERYSLLDRGLEGGNLPGCREHGTAVLAYSPLAHGLLTGQVGPGRAFKEGDLRLGNPRFTPDNRVRAAKLCEALSAIAARHGATLTQLVVAWTVAQPGVTHALVGARSAAQAVENAGGGSLELDPAELAEISRLAASAGVV
jgi:aryl-alcohol dehydrogenase-like predicted oxidoreductase